MLTERELLDDATHLRFRKLANRAVEIKDLSVDSGCTGEVDRESVVERRGWRMEERDKLGKEE